MLAIGRKYGQPIHIGNNIRVVVTDDGPGRVRVAVDAPRHVKVLRGELVERKVA